MKKVFRIVIILLVVLAMAVLVVKRKREAKMVKPYGMRPVTVHVAEVKQRPLEKAHSYLGVAEAWQTAAISSRLSARIEVVPRNEGDEVKAGDLLLQLDDSDLQAQLNAAESSIQSLETNHEFWVNEDRRDGKLAAEGVISKVEAETTHNRLAEAVAKLDAARRSRDGITTQLSYTRLTSPFAGVVSARNVNPGDLAAPGRALMVLEDRSALKIAFDAPQEDVVFLKTGLPVQAKVNGKIFDFAITRIYPSLNQDRMVRVAVKAPFAFGIRIGAFVPLKVVWLRHDEAVTIPRQSLMRTADGKTSVFIVEQNMLRLRPVETVMESDGWIEVKGLQSGKQVVTSTFLGWANLAAGLRVEVVK